MLGTKKRKKKRPKHVSLGKPTCICLLFFYFSYGGPACFGPKVYCEKLKGWKMGMLPTKRTMVNFFRQF
jgi:hypothetical protein